MNLIVTRSNIFKNWISLGGFKFATPRYNSSLSCIGSALRYRTTARPHPLPGDRGNSRPAIHNVSPQSPALFFCGTADSWAGTQWYPFQLLLLPNSMTIQFGIGGYPLQPTTLGVVGVFWLRLELASTHVGVVPLAWLELRMELVSTHVGVASS